MGIKIVLSHNHCTIESHRLLTNPSPRPPSLFFCFFHWQYVSPAYRSGAPAVLSAAEPQSSFSLCPPPPFAFLLHSESAAQGAIASRRNLSLIKLFLFKYLPYLQLHQTALRAFWCRRGSWTAAFFGRLGSRVPR